MRSFRSRSGRPGWWGPLLFGALALLVACSSGDGGAAPHPTTAPPPRSASGYERVGPFPVLDGAASGPGTVLARGIAVPDGSYLLGAKFPDQPAKRRPAGGFVALLLVTGDPVAAYNAVLDDAGVLGMTEGGGGCIPGFGAVTCAATVTDPADGEVLTVRVDRRSAPPSFISHLALHYQPPGSAALGSQVPSTPTPPTSPLPAAPLPKKVSRPAARAWNASVAPDGPRLSLAAGSRLVAPPGSCPCGSRGWSAVFAVSGDPEAVLGAYAAQLTKEEPKLVRRTVGGRQTIVADLGLVVGGIAQLRTVTEAGRTWLMIAVALP